MAVFEEQISAQVGAALKAALAAMVSTDREHGQCSEADVIRLALREGLRVTAAAAPQWRLQQYSRIRREERP